MTSGVYEIRNVVNGHKYIGSSLHVAKRFRLHLNKLRTNQHCNPYLQRAWNKYGESNFVFKPLLYCDKENRVVYEQMCIDGLHPQYNILLIAGCSVGYISSAETIVHISEIQTVDINCLDPKVSEERKTHKHKGYKASSETCAKMSTSRIKIRMFQRFVLEHPDL